MIKISNPAKKVMDKLTQGLEATGAHKKIDNSPGFMADDQKLVEVQDTYPHDYADSRRIGKPYCPQCGKTVQWKEVKS
ncbi:MAG: hypothetical protein A2V67_00370 [Deltaproteobacteria bacterium RBG_13_61_14]|nr:MAG: hypothetical protein A2V67_00370 [Deltaproteobacteria bacterium RBG_13_61_14]